MESAAEHSGPTETSNPIEVSVVWNAVAAFSVTEANEIHRTWLAETSATYAPRTRQDPGRARSPPGVPASAGSSTCRSTAVLPPRPQSVPTAGPRGERRPAPEASGGPGASPAGRTRPADARARPNSIRLGGSRPNECRRGRFQSPRTSGKEIPTYP